VFWRSGITHHSRTHVCVYHKLRVRHAVIIECRWFKGYRVAVHRFTRSTLSPPVCIVSPQLLPGVTSIPDIIPPLSSPSSMICGWGSRVSLWLGCGGGTVQLKVGTNIRAKVLIVYFVSPIKTRCVIVMVWVWVNVGRALTVPLHVGLHRPFVPPH
jgi:hypothetical protein